MEGTMNKIEQVKTIAEECRKIANEYSGEVKFKRDYAMELENSVNELVNSPKPKLMVCGVYSAGKSTLINILCRKEVAKVAAAPTTDKVQEYDEIEDYTIIDSPGVDAPIEHERITDEAIKNSHAIMFVISGANVESKTNYKKLIEWMEYDKPLIIVMNDKGANKLDSTEIAIMREKIVSNLTKCGYGVKSDRYSVIAVNASRAYKTLFGGGDPKLFALSNVGELEDEIKRVMKNGYAMILAPIGELQKILDQMESDFIAAASGNDDEQLRAQLDNIKEEQNRILERLKLKIRDDFESRKQDFIDICMSSESQEELDRQSAQIMESVTKRVQSDYDAQISRFAGVVNTNLGERGITMNNDGTFTINNNTISMNDLMSDVETLFGEESEAADIAKRVLSGATIGGTIGGALGGVAGAAAGEAAATIATTALTSLAAGGLGTVGGGTLAGVPFGPIGMAVGALAGLIGGVLFSRGKKAKQQEEIQRRIDEENRRRQEIMDAQYKKTQTEVGILVNNAAETAVEKISAVFSATVSELENKINEQLSNSQVHNERIAKARNEITVLKANLNAIKAKM